MIPVGRMRKRVSLANPTETSDGRGGTTEAWVSLEPGEVWAAVQTAEERSMESHVANTVESTATHYVTMRYHKDVTTRTRITMSDGAGDHVLFVRSVSNPMALGESSVLGCEEVVSP